MLGDGPLDRLHTAAGLTVAIAHPERVTSLIVPSAAARIMQGPDYPHGMPAHYYWRLYAVDG